MIEIGGQYGVLVQLMYEFLSPSENKYQKATLFTLILYHFAIEAIRKDDEKKKSSPNTKMFSTSTVNRAKP